MEREINKQVRPNGKHSFVIDEQSNNFLIRGKHKQSLAINIIASLIFLFILISSALAIALAYNTEATATWLGFKSGQNTISEATDANRSPKLALVNIRTALLRPFAGLSLGIASAFNPSILNGIFESEEINKFDNAFAIGSDGSTIPKVAFSFTDSSNLKVSDSKMISNLNAEYLRGYTPGDKAGNLVLYNEAGLIPAEKIDGAVQINNISDSLGINPGGGLQNKNGLTLKTTCYNGQVLIWNGNSWDCQDQTAASKQLIASSPLAYNSETGILSFNYDSGRWDSSYSHTLANNNPHNTTANQILPSQAGQNGKVLGTDGSNVSWIMNSAATLWGAITGTLNDQADLVDALADKEDALGSGNASHYLRGDKTWQTLNNATVGLGNVNNTSDANKPISNATQLALDSKASSSTTVNGHALSGNFSITKSDIGLSNLDNAQQLPLSYLDTDATMSANSDSRVASQKATKIYADTKEPALAKGNLTANGAISLSTTRQVIGGEAVISIADSVADGVTKGAAAFAAADFNSSSGVISIDYINGVAADATHKGFLTSADWNTFNGKQGALGFTPVANTLTVNGKALSGDITLGKNDVGLGNLNDVQQLPLSYLDLDGTMAANSDMKVASQKALKTYADTKESAISSGTTLKYFRGDKTWQTLDTSTVLENGSLYYTNARVDTHVQGQNYAITGSWTFNTTAPQSSVTPIGSNDLTNKAYVDSMASGIIPQAPIISFYDPTISLPGSPTSGDRYIASTTANGWTKDYIYEWNGSSWNDNSPITGWSVYNDDTTANYGYNGSAWVLTSTMPSHNNLSGLQGGAANQYYHLNSAQYVIVGNTSGVNSGDETQSSIKSKLGAASSGVDGYLTGTDWNTFNGKQGALGFTPVANTLTVNGKALSGDITLSLASADFANQGTANTVLHGNAAGNPAFSAIVTNDITNNNITYAKIQQIAANSILGNNTAGAANAIELTGAQVKTMLALTKGDVGLGSVENTAISTWSGSANITALGTIASGTWQGTKIAEGYGGTNQSTYTLGDTLYASAANTLSKLGGNTTTTKKFLRQTGTGANSAAPAWDTVTASDIGLGNVSNTAQVTNVTGTSPISSTGGTTPAISIADSVADGVTKGAAAFAAADFNSSSGVISIDYTNGVAADATHKGFLTSADWNTFNGKQGAGNYVTALTGEVTASGPGSAVATIANDAVDFSQMQNINSQVILGRNSASSGDIEALSASTIKSILSLGNVENTALSTWAGTTNLTTLGSFTATGHVTMEGVTSSGATGTGKLVFGTSPTLTTPAIGAATATSLSFGASLNAQTLLLYTNGSAKYGFGVQASELRSFLQSNATIGHTWGIIDAADGTTYTEKMRLSTAGHLTIEGVTSTGATGIGKFVFDSSPSLTTPTLGVATASRLGLGANADAAALLYSTTSTLANTPLVERTDTAANSALTPMRFQHTTSADMIDGFGTTNAFYIKDNAGLANLIGSISFRRNGADNTGKFYISPSKLGAAQDIFAIDDTGHITLEGITSTGATGTGKLVFDTSPTLATPSLGEATATSIIAGNLPATVAGHARFYASEQITEHAHYGFLDNSHINYSGAAFQAHASFNDNVTIEGTQDSDHHHSYQSSIHYDGTGTVNEMSSFWAYPYLNSGTVTNFNGVSISNPAGTGTISNLKGIYVGNLTRGGTNYAIYTEGATPSRFGGTITSLNSIYAGDGGSGNRGIYLGASGAAASLLYNASTGNLDITPRAGYNTLITAGTLGTTGSRVLKIWATDLESTSATLGGLAVDGSTLSIDSVNNRVGIGTSTPAMAFDVVGDIRTKGGSLMATQATPVNSLIISNATSGQAKIYTNTSVPLSLGTNSSTTQIVLNADGTVSFGSSTSIAATASYRIGGISIAAAQTGLDNYFIGNSGNSSATGTDNIAFGGSALPNLTTGVGNTVIGDASGNHLTDGSYNTALGYHAMDWTRGSYNTFIGGSVGGYLDTNNSTTLGYGATIANSLTNATALGYGAIATKNNQLVLGNTDVVETLLQGNVGIGVTDPSDKLVVNGTITGTSFKIGTNNLDTNEWTYLDGTNQALKTTDQVSFKSIATTGANLAADYWGVYGLTFKVGSGIFTDQTSSGTVNNIAMNTIGLPTLAATNATTYTHASTLRIGSEPAAGTNVTITNPWSLWTQSGDVRIDSGLALGSAGLNAGTSLTKTPQPGIGNLTMTNATGSVLTIGRHDNSVSANDILGTINFYSNDTQTAFGHNTAASIQVINSNTAIGSDINPGTMIFSTTNETTPVEALRIDNSQNATFAGIVQTAGYKSSDGTAGLASLPCGANKGIKSVTIKNGLVTAASCTTNDLTDLAENYGTSDPTIAAGDIVSASSSVNATRINTENGVATKAYIEKASATNANSVIGIISDNPEITLGERLYSEAENARPVALSGRVEVKVTNENGAIQKGDLLTVGTTPGYAAKAKDDSVISIGTALEDFDLVSGKIIVFVNITHKLSSSSVVELASTGALQVNSLTVEGDALFKGVIRGNEKFAGKAVMPAGQTELKISKSWPSAPVSVVLTPEYDVRAWTSEITDTGFIIKVDHPVTSNSEISWIAIF